MHGRHLHCGCAIRCGVPHRPISCHSAEARLLSLSSGLQVTYDQQSEWWCLTQAMA